ncbi:MAG: hypothetical protein U0822_19165 [Anaerolineae bacterium]
MIRFLLILLAAGMALGLTLVHTPSASAHQPFFEDTPFDADTPFVVKDPTVSTAVYATLDTPTDKDYYVFDGAAGDSILLEMTIPQILGQDDFAPTMALIGPGLPTPELPSEIAQLDSASGAIVIPAPDGAPQPFFEPFSRTSYWRRQSQRVVLPASGRYTVVVWDPAARSGRYVFVIGDREIPGGDLAFPLKMRRYWTPAPAPEPTRGATGGLGDSWWRE